MNVINSRINDMLILEQYSVKRGKNIYYYYKCKCVKCGRTHDINCNSVRQGKKSTTHRKCNDTIDRREPNFKRFFSIYSDMRTRITNPNYKGYSEYGGRGLTTQYEHLVDFYDDMWVSYLDSVHKYGENNTTLDRIDNEVGYYKFNLQWVDKQIQSENRRCVREFYAYSPSGKTIKTKNIVKFSNEHGLDFRNVHACLNKYKGRKTHLGWTFEYVNER